MIEALLNIPKKEFIILSSRQQILMRMQNLLDYQSADPEERLAYEKVVEVS